MSMKTYRLWRIVITIIVASLVAWAVTTGNVLVPIPTVVAGVIILYLCKRRVKAFTEDERTFRIADKAAMLTLNVFIVMAATAGATLLAISRDGSPATEPAGLTLAYSICTLLILYYIGYIYYNRKLGGKE